MTRKSTIQVNELVIPLVLFIEFICLRKSTFERALRSPKLSKIVMPEKSMISIEQEKMKQEH